MLMPKTGSGSASGYAVLAEGVVKRYRGRGKGGTEKRALDGFDLAVRPGTVHGLLGPNGAGKTTAVRVLATLLRYDAGRAEVAGLDVAREPRRVRSRIGLTGQYAAVDEGLTGRQNLEMFGRLFHLGNRRARQRAGELLDRFDLTEAADKGAKEYSGGMRRRLDLASSMILQPDVLFLDEPTTGLDPRGRGEVWDAVRALVAGGTTVLLTTQYLDEADRLASHITVIDRGRAIADDTPDALKNRVGGDRIEVVAADAGTSTRWRGPSTGWPGAGSSSPTPPTAGCTPRSPTGWPHSPKWPGAFRTTGSRWRTSGCGGRAWTTCSCA